MKEVAVTGADVSVKNGMTETVKRLIQAGARLDEQCRFHGNTALLHALDQKREDIAQLSMLTKLTARRRTGSF